MSAFQDLTCTVENIVCLAAAIVLLFLIPIVFWFVWHKGHKGQLKFGYLLAGAIGFIVSARVLELGVHYFCIIMDNPVSRFINGHTAAYVLYGIIMAGVFEECGRYIVLKYIMKKNKTPENAVLYGIGHAGIEIWAVLLPAIALYLALAIIMNSGNTDALASLKITEETAAAALPSAIAASEFGFYMLAMNVVERILTMFVHIGLTVVVFYGVAENKKGYLSLAIVLHMVVDSFAALYQRAVIPLWLCEVWAALWTVVILIVAVKLYRKMKAQPAEDGVL